MDSLRLRCRIAPSAYIPSFTLRSAAKISFYCVVDYIFVI